MSEGKISDSWLQIKITSVAENVLSFANLSKLAKDHKCRRYECLWNGLVSHSVVDSKHVEKLSSAIWRNGNDGLTSPRVYKEEEEVIKLDVHEGCGRVKVFWLIGVSRLESSNFGKIEDWNYS